MNADRVRPRILFLDDNADLRGMFAETVTCHFGVECALAGSYDELTSMRDAALRCDLVILDVNLGSGKSGIEAYDWLCSEGYAGKLIFLTGHAASHPLTRRAVELGRARVFEKPISLPMIESLLQELRT
jgi:DNA-binding NtrC family response regulator